ncbi:MAG: antitoxin VapB family protein [bacterium]|nr:antitoxin VapB family protein [bacterium]
MVVKTITVTEEAYEKIKGLKREKESFSQLFIRIVNGQKVNIRDFLGVVNLSEKEAKEWEKEMKKTRDAIRETSRRRMNNIEKRVREIEK